MQGLWLTLAWGLSALLAVSVLVALFEYLRQGLRPAQPIESPLPRAVSLDVDVDALPAASEREPEARVALTEVLQRLQQAQPDPAWIETTPMVLAPKATSDSHPG